MKHNELDRFDLKQNFLRRSLSPYTIHRLQANQWGEPGHAELGAGLGTVVGWGVTITKVDKQVQGVGSARQQELEMRALGTQECVDRYHDLINVNLTGVIR